MQECVICHMKTGEFYRKVDDFDVHRCRECKLLWSSVGRDRVGSFYNTKYFNNDPSDKTGYSNYLFEEGNHRRNAQRLLQIVDSKISLKGKRILDVGCAYGFLLDEAMEWMVGEARGIEISSHAYEYAKTKLNLNVDNCEISECRFEKEYFDAVFLVGTLEHLIDPVGVLMEAKRILKEHGILVITTINTSGPFSLYSLKPPEHIYYFNHTNLPKLLRGLGYMVLEAKLHYSGYRLSDLFHRLYAFSSWAFLKHISALVKKAFPAVSLLIPTNEMLVIAQKT